MNNDKTKNIIIYLLVTIIILLIVFISLLVSGAISINGKNDDEVKDAVEEKLDETDNYNEWMKHILNSDIKSIVLKRTVASVDGNADDYNKEVNLTRENLEDIFSKLNDISLIKWYTTGMGIADGNELTISYSINNNNYDFVITNGYIFIETIDDNQLASLLEKSDYTVEGALEAPEAGYVFKFGSSYNGSIYDIYFQ